MQFIEDGKNLGSYYGIAENGKIRLKTGLVTSRLVTHELGHSFDAHYHMYSGGLFSNSHPITLLGNYPINDIEGNFITGFNQNKGRFDRYGDNIAPYNGFISDDYTTEWQWHPLQMDSDGASTTEAFADIFMNWVYNTFSKTPAGLALNNWIITNMSDWINFR